jgi:hypothetical protein
LKPEAKLSLSTVHKQSSLQAKAKSHLQFFKKPLLLLESHNIHQRYSRATILRGSPEHV